MRIGIDIGGTKIEAILLDRGGRELHRERIPTPRDDYEGTVEAVARLVRGCELVAARAGGPVPPVIPVGVGHPGAISPATGRVKNANSLWLNGRPLAEDLRGRLERPVRLSNDANCFALSEAVDGAGRGARVVFGVIIGTGTGGGVVIDGRALAGANAVAGEWGHNPLPWPTAGEVPGPRCYCGRDGCIETYLSGPGMLRDHLASLACRTPGGSGCRTSEEIVRAAGEGDLLCRATLERYHERMARALAAVVNLLDPDVIVLGGGLSKIPSLYTEVPRRWGRWVFSDEVVTRLVPPVHGDSGGVRGAAWLNPEGG